MCLYLYVQKVFHSKHPDHGALLGDFTLVRCVNLETSLLTRIHQELTLSLHFRQGVYSKQMAGEDLWRSAYIR